jgi:hypothetical protein
LLVLRHEYVDGRIDDYLTELDAVTGELRKSISLREAIERSPYAALLPDEPKGDYLHTNSIEIVDKDWASQCGIANEGDVVMSHNQSSIVTLLDVETETIKWALTGVSHGAHDPDLIDDCTIVFFDNNGGKDDRGVHSRLLSYNFNDDRVGTVYSDPENFLSINRGSQQRLNNGHWLITESTQGTIFETDGDGTVVWKYITPKRTDSSVCVVNAARSYDAAELPFLNPVSP